MIIKSEIIYILAITGEVKPVIHIIIMIVRLGK